MQIRYNADGLVPAIVQDVQTGKVLMMAWMNAEALNRTRETGLVTFFSRSRSVLWTKGETSGHTLKLVEIVADCDGDTLLVKAIPTGPACHTGTDTCWGESNDRSLVFLAELEEIITRRAQAPAAESYTRRLIDAGAPKVSQKVGEEAVETVVAALAETDDRVIDEASDLVFHLMVLLRTRGLTLTDVAERLASRHRS